MLSVRQGEIWNVSLNPTILGRFVHSLYIRFQNKVGVVSGELLKNVHLAIETSD